MLVSAIAALALVGCGGGGAHSTGAGGSGGGSALCATSSASGTLTIRITGTPSGTGQIELGGGTIVTATSDLTLPAGPQDVIAFLVAEGADRVRIAYTPTVDEPSPCVHAGQTTIVNVSYAAIPSSGHVWMGASNAPSPATLLGYAPAAIGASGTPSAAVAVNTFGSDGFTFDPYGNVWVTGATTADAPVARYPASMLASDGDKIPDITIESPSFGNSSPGPKVLAFDPTGNLWVSVVAEDKVVRFNPTQIAASGTPTADVEESGIIAPAGIAFDAAGNMWVAANGDASVVRIDAAHLSTSGSGTDLTLTAWTPSPVISTLSSPLGLAFDADGNLWVNYDGILARLTPSDLSGTGAKSVTPEVQIDLDVQSLPTGMAFDETGGLWLADRVGRFACLSPSQLTVSSSVVPAIIIDSPDLGSAGWFALYPAPAFTPLAHALP